MAVAVAVEAAEGSAVCGTNDCSLLPRDREECECDSILPGEVLLLTREAVRPIGDEAAVVCDAEDEDNIRDCAESADAVEGEKLSSKT